MATNFWLSVRNTSDAKVSSGCKRLLLLRLRTHTYYVPDIYFSRCTFWTSTYFVVCWDTARYHSVCVAWLSFSYFHTISNTVKIEKTKKKNSNTEEYWWYTAAVAVRSAAGPRTRRQTEVVNCKKRAHVWGRKEITAVQQQYQHLLLLLLLSSH